MVIERAEVRSGDRVVDIGCGPGESVALAAASTPGVQVVGVDPAWPFRAATALRALGRRGAVRVRRGAAERLPVPDGWATLVISINAFHHWEDPRRGLAEVRRVLAPGGRLVLVDEDFPEDHQHTRFHREAGEDAPVDAGSPEVREWVTELGFGGLTLDRVEDADGTPHHLLRAALLAGAPRDRSTTRAGPGGHPAGSRGTTADPRGAAGNPSGNMGKRAACSG